MGLTSSLSVGRTALLAYQAALQVVGNNIANSATPGYARSTVRLGAIPGPGQSGGQIGSGVRLEAVRRQVSEALQARMRSAGSDTTSSSAEQSSLSRIESIFNPLGDGHLGSLMQAFFKSVGDLQNTPENIASRGIVISSAQALAERIRGVRSELIGVREEADGEIETSVKQADALASEIADLNVQITVSEAGSGGGTAGALRDRRDQALSELSEIVEIVVREQPSGAINVYVGNDSLIQGSTSFGLKTVQEIGDDGLARLVVRFKSDNGEVTATSGKLEGLIKARDEHSGSQIERLDALAAAIIFQVNKIHSSGQGLAGFSSHASLNSVNDPSLALSDAANNLAFVPQAGSFFIDVKNTATGEVVRTQVNIDLDGIGTDSTLDSVAADISANAANLSATVAADGRMQITAASGYSFTFADDTSGFLASMGMNSLFTGRDSVDIDVNSLVAADPKLLAAGRSSFSGDGSNATELAELQSLRIDSLGGISLNDYYLATTADVAVRSSTAKSSLDAAGVIFDSLTNQREALSGVSLDEEAIAMVSYQRAYQGAARFMNVVDEMMQTLLSIVR